LDNGTREVRDLHVVVQEHVNDEVAALGMVEEYEQTPMDQPRALLQSHQSIGKLLQNQQ
jgi:hypothetical protein